MKSGQDPVEVIRKEIETWDSPFVELDCFGTDDAEQIASVMNEFCQTHLHSRVRGYFFYRASIGSTHGIQLEDDSKVVIKVRPPPETNPDLSFDKKSLETICAAWLGWPPEATRVPKSFSVPLR
jgi:hypothetical protein